MDRRQVNGRAHGLKQSTAGDPANLTVSMGLALPAKPPCHAFIRVAGQVDDLGGEGLQVTSVTHYDIDGALVTEALVTGPDAVVALQRRYPGARCLVAVTYPAWVEQSILVAAGKPHGSAGSVAVHALRAPYSEADLVSHPNAPYAADILRQVASGFDRWVSL